MIRELFYTYSHRLQKLYPKQEAENLVFWLFEYFLGLNRMDVLQDKKLEGTPEALDVALSRLMEGIPIQYITQSAPFYGRDFMVNPSVLIPRNETEELVHLIVQENRKPGLRIMDIGTGSGCIPITLALEMDQPKIWAVDISAPALDLAKKNSAKFMTEIGFYKINVLKEYLPINQLDVLISNPPYVRESEKAAMHTNVIDHEPHLALFVSDEDPLLFYREIAKKGLTALNPDGKVYFEINEALGNQVVGLLSDLGFNKIRLIKDLNDKDRIVTAIK